MMKHEPAPVPGSNWKWIGIPVIIAIAFMGLLYLAMATEPEYMPANQKKAEGVDPHASHGAAPTEAKKYTAEEHAQHSTEEHTKALAEEAAASSDATVEETAPANHTESHGH